MNSKFFMLEQNITTTIYEGLLKIGYGNNENFSIFYDLDLLNYLLKSNFTTNEACYLYLNDFYKVVEPRLGNITISLEKKRFRFTVTKKGIENIYKLYEKDDYLKRLIELVKTHNFTLEDVLGIFKESSYEFICEESKNQEFQYVIYLKNSKIDPFRYCFAFDQMGGYYHRLLDYDYQKVISELH
jgi:hypothetical protein